MRTLHSIAIAIALAVGLSACGKGLSKLSEAPSKGTVNGHAVDAMIVDGTVSVYAWDNGIKGEFLGAAPTDAAGHYSMALNSPDRPILIELTGGTYVEEASGLAVSLSPSQRLRAVTHYRPGDALTAMVTPWTNIAAGLAAYKVAGGRNPDNAITEANVAISSILGLDILNTYPRNITDPANVGALDDERMYGAIEAGMSLWAAWASQQNGPAGPINVTTIQLAQILYDDIVTDGLLDGYKIIDARSVPLAAGAVLIDANVYRAGFASKTLYAIGDPKINKTGITVANALSNAQKLAGSRSAAFGTKMPESLDKEPPIVKNKFPDNGWVGGVVPYSAEFADFVGVAAIEYDVDGKDVVKIPDIDQPAFQLNTKNYTDGAHKMGVRATDFVGNETYVQFPINFMNTGILATVESPLITNQFSYAINGKWTDNGPGLSKIQVQGKDAVVKEDGTWTATVALKVGYTPVVVRTLDAVGNTRDTTVTMGVDIKAPKVFFGEAGSGTLTNFVNPNDPNPYVDFFSYANGSQMPLWVYSDKVSANGVALTTNALGDARLPAFDWRAYDDSCTGSLPEHAPCSTAQQLTAKLQYVRNGDTLNPIYAKIIKADVNSDLDIVGVVGAITEFLDDKWHTFSKETEHQWILSVSDQAGNTTTKSFKFKADVRQTPSPTSVVANNFAQGVAWASRGTLYGKYQLVESYTYDNTNGSTHFFSLDDAGSTYSAAQVVDSALRENKYQTRTVTQWEGMIVNYPCYSGPCTVTGWTPIAAFQDCVTGTTHRMPDPVISAAIDLYDEAIPIKETDTGWVNYDPLAGTNCINYSNQGTSRDPWEYANYLIPDSNGGATGSLYAQVKANDFTLGAYTVWTTGKTLLDQRIRVIPEYAPGYPRTHWGTINESYGTTNDPSSTLIDQLFKVITAAGAEIKPNAVGNKDWYRVMAGQTITIQRLISIPNIKIHNDPDISNTLSKTLLGDPYPTYIQYTTQYADKAVTFYGDVKPLGITRSHASDIATVDSMTHERMEYCQTKEKTPSGEQICTTTLYKVALSRPPPTIVTPPAPAAPVPAPKGPGGGNCTSMGCGGNSGGM